MNTIKTPIQAPAEIEKAHQLRIAEAYKIGRQFAKLSADKVSLFEKKLAALAANPYAVNGLMPLRLATPRGSLWHAYASGVARECGDIKGAGTWMRSARFLMRRAIALARIDR